MNFCPSHSHLNPFVAQNGNKGVPNALAVMLIEEKFVTLLRRTRVHVHNVRTTGETKNNMSQNIEIQDASRIDALFERISALIEQARQRVATTINIAEVYTKYSIGQYIPLILDQGINLLFHLTLCHL